MTNEKSPILAPTLVLMRHAARDFSDDGLSPEGERQSLRLQEILIARRLSTPTLLESSPKRRTRATLRPLSDSTGQKVLVRADLDERTQNETAFAFEKRVKNFCDEADEWAQNLVGQNTTDQRVVRTRLACSHLDWLEAAVQFLASDEGDLERAESWPAMSLRVYRFQDGIWRRTK